MKRLTVLAVIAVLGAGCTDRGVMDVSPQQNAQPSAMIASPPGNPGLTVMTWNVYYGTDPTIVLAAPSPDLIPVYAAQAWALLNQTNFPQRAEALAQAIAANRPEIVGVQEAALWRIQETSDFNPMDPTPNAEEVVYDFLTLLTNALEARVQHYVVAAVDVSTDIEVPMVVLDESGNPVLDESGNPVLSDIRLTDRDAVLVRKGVQYSDPQSGVYTAAIPIELRDPAEVRGYGPWRWAPEAMPAWNPSFDVTPVDLVTSLVLDRGVYSAQELKAGALTKG